MPTQISPGVISQEIDLSTAVPATASDNGAIAGNFAWGPLNQVTTMENEDQLVKIFGKPNTNNFVSFFTAANFLAYANKLRTVRIMDETTGLNATSESTTGGGSAGTGILIKNDDHYLGQYADGSGNVGTWAAKFAGTLGNGLKVSLCPSATAFERAGTLTTLGNKLVALGGTATHSAISAILVAGNILVSSTGVQKKISSIVTSTTGTVSSTGTALTGSGTSFLTTLPVGSILQSGGEIRWVTAVASDTAATLNATFTVNISSTTVPQMVITLESAFSPALTANSGKIRWEFYDAIGVAPGTSNFATGVGASGDEMHVVVVDGEGKFSGISGQILERFSFISKAPNAKLEDGTSNYYVEQINRKSQFIRWMDHLPAGTNWGTTAVSGLTYTAVTKNDTKSLTGGHDGGTPVAADFIRGLGLFRDVEQVDVSIILGADATTEIALYAIQNVAEYRKDCIVVLSPERADVVNNVGGEATAIIEFRNTLPSSSYFAMDTGWKQQYDKYNDVYRYVPCNGDVGGIMASLAEAHESPAGFNRGNIKGVVKMAYVPNKADRDDLYKNGINPIVTFPGSGTILYGDKTGLSRPSAFDRIGVRRLFIVLRKSISKAAKFSLFEFNDEFTRSSFKNLVEPYLRDVKGKRGLYDFKVVCDTSNNTPEVIDGNEFRADIYLKPARSINYITLSFVAVRTGVEFSEIVGQIG